MSRYFFVTGLLFIGCDSPQNNAKRVCHCWDMAFNKEEDERPKEILECRQLEAKVRNKFVSNPTEYAAWKGTLSQCFQDIAFQEKASKNNVLCDVQLDNKESLSNSKWLVSTIQNDGDSVVQTDMAYHFVSQDGQLKMKHSRFPDSEREYSCFYKRTMKSLVCHRNPLPEDVCLSKLSAERTCDADELMSKLPQYASVEINTGIQQAQSRFEQAKSNKNLDELKKLYGSFSTKFRFQVNRSTVLLATDRAKCVLSLEEDQTSFDNQERTIADVFLTKSQPISD